jgi:hypothetical protein
VASNLTDLRFGARLLLRAPGFAAVAVLALGDVATAAMVPISVTIGRQPNGGLADGTILPAHFTPAGFIAGLTACAGISALAAFAGMRLPLRRALAVAPAQALRSE